MMQIPYAKQQQSQIKLAESQITNIDKNIVKVLQLFSITGTLDLEIEKIRLELAENSNFYPEALFTYLKKYQSSDLQGKQTQHPQFFDFTDLQNQAPVVINIINSSKEGIIKLDDLVSFMNDYLKMQVNKDSLKQLERIYHIDQFGYFKDQALDTANNEYPLPQDVTPIMRQNLIEGTNKIPLAKQESIEKINSGEGFNFITFQKMILSQSIPIAKQKAQKRKLIYETNQEQNIDQAVIKAFGNLLNKEIELLEKSEKIRLILNTDPSYNHVAMFNLLDSHGNGDVSFSFLEQLMNKAQIPFKPQNFSSLVRRANLLCKSNSLSDSLQFEGYRLLASALNPYFKIPKQEQDSNVSTVEYSRILGVDVMGQNNSQLSISRIPDKLKNSTQNYRSKPMIPLYNSCNPYINESLKKQSKIQGKDKDMYDTMQNDYIIYGTKSEWEELQHTINQGIVIDSKSLKSQISKIQNSQINISQTRNSQSNPPTNKSQIQQIQEQAYQEDLERRKNNEISKQLQQAMNVNTKGYYTNAIKIEQEKNNFDDTNQNVVQAPWYKNDLQMNNKINQVQQQHQQLQKFSGYKIPKDQRQQNLNQNNNNNQQRIQQNNNQQEIDLQQQQQQQQQQQIQDNNKPPLSGRIFSPQRQTPLIYQDNFNQKIMDYKFQIPKRQFEYNN